MRLLALLLIILPFTCTAASPPRTVTVRVVAINDFHGHLEADADGQGGAVALAATLDRLSAEEPSTFFVSTGDLIGASPLPSALAHDEPTLALFKHLVLQVNTIGNHEFDGGLAELRRQQELAGFPFLSSNLWGGEGYGSMLLLESQGVRVGFVGATARNSLKPLEPDSVRGLELDDEAASMNKLVPDMHFMKAHAVVALLHEGAGAQDSTVPPEACDGLAGPAREITRKLDPEIDLVLSAHTHARYACKVDGRWLVQGGAYGRFLSVADLHIDPTSGEVVDIAVRHEPVRLLPGETPDPFVVKLVDDAVAAAKKISEAPVSKIAGGRVSATPDNEGGSPLGRLVARAQLAAGTAQGAQLACTNPSSVPRDLVASGENSMATYADVRAVQPYGNHLKVLKVSGAQLSTLLAQQWRGGASPALLSCTGELAYKTDREGRIVPGSLSLAGRVLADTDTITMVVNSYLARGGQDFQALVGIAPIADAGLDLDALLGWLAKPKSPRR